MTTILPMRNPILVAFVSLISFSSCLKQKDDKPTTVVITPPAVQTTFDWNKIADSAQTSLSLFYNVGGNYYQTSNSNTAWAQYWPTAHALDVLVDAYLRSPSATLKAQMENLLVGMKAKNGGAWPNYYYDDMEWMALASLRAYVATTDARYKDIVDILWADIKGGWSTDLGGGIWWRKDNPSKNTPSNMPAAILAARLYKIFNRPDDLQWATNIYTWQKATLYDGSGLVYDNVDKNGTKNTSWKFTYNQGTFIGAATELYKLTGNTLYYNDAIVAADYTLNSGLTNNGILKDEGGGDGGLFKGVFVRYLTRFFVDGNIEASKKSTYINYLKKNAETLWTNGANKSPVLFNTDWSKAPPTSTDLTTQLSGMMLMEAAAELKKIEPFLIEICMKNVLVFVLCVLLAFTINAQTAGVYKERINIIKKNISKYFFDEKKGYYKEFTHRDSNDKKEWSYLWPLCALVQAANETDRLGTSKNFTLEILQQLKPYYDVSLPAPGYNAYILKEGKEDRFYDDNQWIGIACMDAYQRTHNERYLQKSKEIYRFMMTGFDTVCGGGLYWKEGDFTTKNTCSNGPGILLALQLYKATRQKNFLDTALLLYNWANEKLLSSEGIYYDHIQLPSAKIDKRFYTYNAGTMLQASVLLYEVSGKKSFLLSANKIARAAYIKFFNANRWPSNYWFNAVLLRGYLQLRKYSSDDTYIASFVHEVNEIWQKERNDFNLIGNTQKKTLLDQAAVMEMCARLAYLKSSAED